MIVVADTTPINYLILIDREFILPELFGNVIVPKQVLREMQHPKAPSSVRKWASDPPKWARIEAILVSELIRGLGPGENAAIYIALDINADAVLTDDQRGIREASSRGIIAITTFALLERASDAGLVDFAASIHALSETNFHMPPDHITEEYLRRNRTV